MPGRATPAMPAVLGAVRPGQQRVDQRVGGVARRRVDDEAGRLVDDQQVVVLVDDVERDVGRRGEVERDDRRDVEPQLGPRLRRSRSPSERSAVGGQATVGDQLLDVAPRQAGRVGDEAVDPADALPSGTRSVARTPRGDRRRQASTASSPSPPRRSTTGKSAISDEQQDRGAHRGVGDVERAEPEVADAHVDPVDDVAEAEPVDAGCRARRRAAARARPRGRGCGPSGRGTRRSARRPRATRGRTASAWSRKRPKSAPRFWLKISRR